jgi:transposase
MNTTMNRLPRAWHDHALLSLLAEAICEAVQRPSMRFVAVKSEQQQAAGLVFRTHDPLVR